MSRLSTLKPHLFPAILGVGIVMAVIAVIYFFFQKPAIAPTPSTTPPTGNQRLVPGEPLAAEITGLSFLDLVFSYADNASPESKESILQLLSPELAMKFLNSPDDFETQLLDLLQLSQWPDQGFSEEDLQFKETSASLIIGLNYTSSPRLLREIQLINLEGKWLISGVETLETYPPESTANSS